MKKKIIFALILLSSLAIDAQSLVHEKSEHYIAPTEPEFIKKLSEWQDLKFGVLMHYGV